jgi:hypothetical protein
MRIMMPLTPYELNTWYDVHCHKPGLPNYGPRAGSGSPYTFMWSANVNNKCLKNIKIRGNNSLAKKLLSFILCTCLWKALLLVLIECLLALNSVKNSEMKYVKSTYVSSLSDVHVKPILMTESKKAWTTYEQDFISKAWIPQLWLRFVCRPDRARIIQIQY